MATMPTVEFVEDDHDGYYVVAGATFRSLTAAARAVVEALDRGDFDNDLMHPEMVPAMDTLYALRAAVEAADQQ